MSADDRIRYAVLLAKSGQKGDARQVIAEVLKSDRRNADAWLVSAQLAPSRAEAIECMQQVVRLRPDDARARQILARLQGKPKRRAPPARKPSAAPRARSPLNIRVLMIGGLGILALILVGAVGVVALRGWLGESGEAAVAEQPTEEHTDIPTETPSQTPVPTATDTRVPTDVPTPTLTPTSTLPPTHVPTMTNTPPPTHTPPGTPRPTATKASGPAGGGGGESPGGELPPGEGSVSSDDDPSIGPASAPVTMIEFSDFL